MSTGKTHLVEKVGIYTPKEQETPSLNTGEVGFLVAGIKDIYGLQWGYRLLWLITLLLKCYRALKQSSLEFLQVFIP